VQDSSNLAWKLALVLRGDAGPELLDTYTAERAPIGRQVVDRANRPIAVVGADQDGASLRASIVARIATGSSVPLTPNASKMRPVSASRPGSPTRIPGARIDVWQADEQGSYDVESGGRQPLGNGRGLFTADDEGRFWFSSIVPAHNPTPTDGPVGALLRATKRHPYRPAHVHFIVEAPGYVPVTTHVFVEGSEYLDSDAVFAVKQSLVRDFATVDDAEAADRYGLPNPFRRARFDIVLQPAAA
jgi:hydroxyquinol 1,2-dioxygenase